MSPLFLPLCGIVGHFTNTITQSAPLDDIDPRPSPYLDYDHHHH